MPNISSVTSSVKTALPGGSIPGLGELKGAGIDIPNAESIKSMASGKMQEAKNAVTTFRMPTKDDLKSIKPISAEDVSDYVTGKIDSAKTKLEDIRENGASALIPQEYKELGATLESAGVTIDGAMGQLKGESK